MTEKDSIRTSQEALCNVARCNHPPIYELGSRIAQGWCFWCRLVAFGREVAEGVEHAMGRGDNIPSAQDENKRLGDFETRRARVAEARRAVTGETRAQAVAAMLYDLRGYDYVWDHLWWYRHTTGSRPPEGQEKADEILARGFDLTVMPAAYFEAIEDLMLERVGHADT